MGPRRKPTRRPALPLGIAGRLIQIPDTDQYKKESQCTKDFSFGADIFDYVPPPEEELRTLLDRWIDQFSSDDFAEYISSKGVKAWAVGYEAAAHHVDLLLERLTKVLSELKSL